MQPLAVHPGRRYLMTTDGEPFFYLGDTAWELLHALSREETREYLDVRQQQGFNVIQTVALAEFDGLRTPNHYGRVPLSCRPFGHPALEQAAMLPRDTATPTIIPT